MKHSFLTGIGVDSFNISKIVGKETKPSRCTMLQVVLKQSDGNVRWVDYGPLKEAT
jgi:hypothetical protein